ncbi:choice-of-anchor R domain-containing protein [Candidatus Poriferisodalis sp.]|uniref:choice-of-anchor R domain-containing protein n=1 Tax=Candidatus Poriferisodalis sp. TaxID=3101277 RepID=UPI003B5CD12E
MTSKIRINRIGSASRVAALLQPSTGALIPRGIVVALLAMVLAGMAVWATPASADAEEPAEPVWSADMTVVEYTTVSIGAASADLFSNVGGSGNLQIKSLWSHTPNRDLRLAFQEDVPNAADYTLQVGDLSLEFPAGNSGASSFKWHGVDVDWEEGQLIRVRIVLTSRIDTAEIDAPQANTPATGVPTISGTAQVGETLAADTSGIADEDGLDSVSYHYQWIRNDASITDATDSAYTLTDDDQGNTIKLKVSFIDDNGNSETLTSAAREEVSKRPQFLVSNLDVGTEGAGGIQRTLYAARSGFDQAFATGSKTNGYALDAVDIHMSHFYDASNAADQLRVTISEVASEGEPGDAYCTLTNPSSFSTPGVIAFEAPTWEGACPPLAAETTYFVVIEWLEPSGADPFAVIPQTYPTEDSAATEEDPGGAQGWSIADKSYYLSVSSDVRTWTEYDETASFKIKVKGTAAAGEPAEATWTALMSVGASRLGDEAFLGYSVFGPVGSLTSTQFATSHTLQTTVGVLAAVGEDLWLRLGGEPAQTFTLATGDRQFNSADATVHRNGYSTIFQWSRASLQWFETEIVSVSITLHTDTHDEPL